MNIKNGINVLSLFDGISVAQLALKELNIPINSYHSSEIDKNAKKVTLHHFPGTIQLGDVRNVDGTTLPPIDLMIFGSPCQDLSSMRKDRKGLEGEKSGLLFEALRIMDEVKPKYFVLENVGSMSKYDKQIINDLLGVEGKHINSNLVSNCNRHRIYWSNINFEQPTDRKLILQNIVEDGFVDRKKGNAVLTKNVPYTVSGLKRYLTKSIGQVAFYTKDFAYAPKNEKLDIIEGMTNDEVRKLFRPLNTVELSRLQTLPDNYLEILKKTPSHHCIGNSFTLEVIKHILSHADFN